MLQDTEPNLLTKNCRIMFSSEGTTMSNIFDSVTEKLGLTKEGVTDEASKLLDQHRDQIPDAIEGKIDEALHGGMLGGLLDKVGLGGHKKEESEEATSGEASSKEDAVEEQESETATSEEGSGEENAVEEEESEDDSEKEAEK